MKVIDYDLIKDIKIIQNSTIVLYGAGYRGKNAFDLINGLNGANVTAFCESNPEKWAAKNKSNKELLGLPVLSPKSVSDNYDPDDLVCVLSVSSEYFDEILDTIRNNGRIQRIVTYAGLYAAIHANIKNTDFSATFRKEFLLREKIASRKTKLAVNFGICDELMSDYDCIVYSYAKTGSSTVYASLKAAQLRSVHAHIINGYNMECRGYDESISEAYQEWKNGIRKRKTKVISLVREPISRSISQYIYRFKEDYILSELTENIDECAVNSIISDMETGDGGISFSWFNSEIRSVFGIDVYKYPFDRERGYGIIRENNTELLVLTLEKLNSNIDTIKSFIGDERMNHFELINSNVLSKTMLRFLYDDLKKNIRIPKKVIEFYYDYKNSPMRHFYTDDEIEEFRRRYI